MNITEIPLTPNNQQFRIQLAGVTYTIKIVWRDTAGWIMDLMDSGDEILLSGVPLVPGVDLLGQYPDLGVSGAMVVGCDNGSPEYPTKTNLGGRSHLIFVQE